MRVRIGTKLIAGFMLFVLMIAAMAFYSINISQKFLRQSVVKSSISLAEEILKRIDQDIYNKIEALQIYSKHLLLQETLSESNIEFEKIDGIEVYINQKEKEWVSASKDEITPFMQGLITNALSNSLRKGFVNFYENKYGYQTFVKLLATNKYGANVAQTGKTSDYRQDDEKWWQIAREERYYVSNIEYDESAAIFAISIGVRVDNEEGDFIGVMKAIIVFRGIIKEAEIATKKYETTRIKIITKDGNLIYRTTAFKFLEDVSDKSFFKQIKGESGFFVAKKNGKERLFSYVRSKGYRDFGGLGWILVVGHDVQELLKPAFQLRNMMTAAFLILITIGIIIAFFMSRSITRSIASLTEGAEIIGKGDLEHKIDIKSKDEIGELSTAFNQMTKNLRKVTASRDELNTEVLKRKRAEEVLKAANQQLSASEQQLRAANQQLRVSEHEMRKMEENWRESFNSLEDVMILIDKDFSLEKINAHGLKIIEKFEEDILGKKCYEVFYGMNFPCEGCPLKKSLETGKVESLDRFEEDLGKHFFLKCSPVFDEKGKIVRFVELIQDITELKEAEEKLKTYSEKLEEMVEERTQELRDAQEELVRIERLAVLGQLAGGVGHELRNPLGVISNAVYYLKMIQPEADDTIREYLETILQEVNNSTEIVSDLLDLSRTKPAERGRIDVSDLINQVLDRHSPPDEVEVTTEIASDLPSVHVDSRQIGQVLSNLVTNGYQAMSTCADSAAGRPGGGRLIIIADEFCLDDSIRIPKPEIRIRVSDTGCGISKENMEKLFQPLFTTKSRGIGLGLAVSKSLVVANGGRIKVESEEGKGSTFTVILPTWSDDRNLQSSIFNLMRDL